MVRPFDPVILFLGIYFKEKLLKKKNSVRKKDIYCVTPDGEIRKKCRWPTMDK